MLLKITVLFPCVIFVYSQNFVGIIARLRGFSSFIVRKLSYSSKKFHCGGFGYQWSDYVLSYMALLVASSEENFFSIYL